MIISSPSEVAYEMQGIPVKMLLDFLQETEKPKVLITVTQRYQKEIADGLCEGGYKDYEIISHEFLYALTMDSQYLLLEEKLENCQQ